ncbi:hypothetical protein VKT23_007654 [Stygiomarasmius scandens]|uniref:Major facilitator superfamily (MFS) profile domain-containing protein n=1 Tax=Marasmiellus scandens TaxID=2682957 RepID=A0ABR1JPQ9_9AGAR
MPDTSAPPHHDDSSVDVKQEHPTATTGGRPLATPQRNESTFDDSILQKEKKASDVQIITMADSTTVEVASAIASEDTQGRTSRREWLQYFVSVWAFLGLGWNDGALGPLLPRIQEVYNVGFTIVSLLFVFNFIGYVSGAGLNIWFTHRLGFGKTIVIGACFNIAAYAIQTAAPPFPVFVLSFVFAGFGCALQNSQANGFVGSLKRHKSSKLMCLHASYGLGALCSPFLATRFAILPRWSFYYFSSLAVALSNLVAQLLVFRLKRTEELLREIGQEDPAPVRSIGDTEKIDSSANSSSDSASSDSENQNVYRQVFSIKAVHYLTLFAFIYIGVEVSVGSWIVSFIIRERGGGESSGYISSGFFAGLMLGRVVLIPVNKWIGEYFVVYIYMALCIALEITIWLVPSIIENAIAVSFIGLFLGPMFPIIVVQSVKIFPPHLFTGAVGWITGVGVAGSAALPFVTGTLATRYGIRSLQPFMVAMMAAMVCIWILVPRRK